ncbi:MAG: hypothetical protein BWY85_00546 [Firmicutes bacterium ADurb.Bin506]|jgi:hypothetical protein|nr:MAG: hypothetical protein BWY85_00546 [Firmicutes bacterium ADurb.Bin506]
MLPPDDFPFTTGWGFLVSEKVTEVLRRLGVPGIDYYRSEIICPDGEVIPGYASLNILKSVSCMNRERSVFDTRTIAESLSYYGIHGLYVDQDRIPADALVFRLLEDRTALLVHERVKEELEATGVRGIQFVPTLNLQPSRQTSSASSKASPRPRSDDRPLSRAMASAGVRFDAPESGHELFEAILDARFVDAARIADSMDEEDVWAYLGRTCINGPDLRVYGFWVSRLLMEEKPAHHFWAAMGFMQPLVGFEGGLLPSLMHLRRAIDLEPNEIRNKAMAFVLYGSVSPQAFPRSEAILIGRDVVAANPGDDLADKLRAIESGKLWGDPEDWVTLPKEGVEQMKSVVKSQSLSPDQLRFLSDLVFGKSADSVAHAKLLDRDSLQQVFGLFSKIRGDVLAYGYWVYRLLQGETAQDRITTTRPANCQRSPGAWQERPRLRCPMPVGQPNWIQRMRTIGT